MRVSNPRCDLDALPTKELHNYKDIFLVFWLVNNEKKSMIQSKVLGDLSQNKPNERGVRRMPRYDPNAYAYDEIA